MKGRFEARKKLFPGIEPAAVSEADDWPTFLKDNRRSGSTRENIPLPTGLVWSRRLRRPPAPAWSDEAKAESILQLRAGVLSKDERPVRFFANRPGCPF